ncbi:STAS domain-containing protein [Nonomuraea sp. NPDC059007]|uniref:STAS domain-containing protein n=1 Tax=Nonomuraea sp. NPDC059007 TaxID=3346692 RepID=UPI00367963FA
MSRVSVREITEVVMTPLSLMTVSMLRGTLITVTGELDAGNVAQLADYVAERHTEPGLPLVLDLSGLTFMDSTGLSLLLHLRAGSGEHGGSLHLATVQPRPARILEVTGAYRQFNIHPTLETALQASGLTTADPSSADIA